MADQYDRMTTQQLEANAADRDPPVDLSDATTNAERARLLRLDDDRAAAAAAETGQPTPETAETAEPAAAEEQATPEPVGGALTGDQPVTAEETTQDQVGEAVRADPDGTPLDKRAAPYVDEDDLQHRQDAASGAETPQQDLGEVPEVGGHQDDK